MTRLSRFLPKFLRGGDKGKLNNGKVGDKSHCKIMFLDDTEYFLPYKGGFKGQYVLEKIFEQLNLFETDYFGLRYIDQTGQTHWLESNKTLSSQLKGCSIPYTFYFGVKFYPADPCKLKEEITRYQFFLQLKRDILHGRLPVTFDEAVELFAYAVQSELGDFESQTLQLGYVSEFQFVPNQTEELEERITAIHRRLGGTVPPTAELKFLDKVKWLDMYGVDLHPVLGEGNTEYFLGLTPTGIVVYKNKTKVGNYFWPRITKVTNKAKVFIIRVKDKINDEHTYAFELPSKAACKHLWKCCVEHHAFFRLNQANSASLSTVSREFRSTAKHRNSGRQERQNHVTPGGREQPQVMRVQSRRQARRALSDSRLNQADRMQTGVQYSEGHVTMVVNPEPVKGSRHRSLPDLKGRESPTSTCSAPWETNMDTGLYTSGRESPASVTQSENVNYMRRHRESDSESGHRRNHSRRGYDSDGGRARQPHHYRSNHSFSNTQLSRRSDYDSDAHSSMYSSTHRRKYFPSSRKGSDNESDVSFTRRRRRELDSGSESDISPKYTARQRNAKSVGADAFEQQWHDAMQNVYVPGKENRPNGSVHSAPLAEARQKKMRRRRSKSPGNSKRPPEELRQHIEFGLLEPSEEMTEEQMREIPYVNVETKAGPFKPKLSPKSRHRYRSPKRKSASDVELTGHGGYISEDSTPAVNPAQQRTPEPAHRPTTKPVGYYSDTGSRVDSLSRNRLGQPVIPPQYKNTQNNINTDSKQHFVTDIRSIPQFHQNLLFYEPEGITSPGSIPAQYQSLPRYHPPPASIFKPIETLEDKHSVIDVGATNSHATLRMTVNNVQWQISLLHCPTPSRSTPQHQNTTDPGVVGAQELRLDLQGHLNDGDEGQGHDPEEDRNRDSGLNSSQSSSSAAWNTTPRSAGQQGTPRSGQQGTPRSGQQNSRMFGTQDAIAKLYSSPAAGNRALNQPVNQSPAGTNRGVPYKQTTNPNLPYNQHQSPSQSVHNQIPSSVPSYQTGTSSQGRDSAVPYAHMNGGYNNRTQQQSYNLSNRTQNYSQNDSHGQEYIHDYRNQSNFANNSYSQQNRTAQYRDLSHAHDHTSPSKQSHPQQTYPSQNSYPSSSMQNTFQSGPQSHSNRTDQTRGSQYQSGNYNQSQYQSNGENRLGVQPSWQYVGNGDVRSSSATQSGYRPSPSVQRSPSKHGAPSSYSRSPSSSPSKKQDTSRQIELSPAGDQSGVNNSQSFNSSGISAPKFRSPDSAISSLTSSMSLNNNNLSNNNNIYTSPAMSKKLQQPVHDGPLSQDVNFSRARAPAFGTSEIWTEL